MLAIRGPPVKTSMRCSRPRRCLCSFVRQLRTRWLRIPLGRALIRLTTLETAAGQTELLHAAQLSVRPNSAMESSASIPERECRTSQTGPVIHWRLARFPIYRMSGWKVPVRQRLGIHTRHIPMEDGERVHCPRIHHCLLRNCFPRLTAITRGSCFSLFVTATAVPFRIQSTWVSMALCLRNQVGR